MLKVRLYELGLVTGLNHRLWEHWGRKRQPAKPRALHHQYTGRVQSTFAAGFISKICKKMQLQRVAGAKPFTASRPAVAPRPVVRQVRPLVVAQAAEAAVAEPSTATAKSGVARLSFQRGSVFKVFVAAGIFDAASHSCPEASDGTVLCYGGLPASEGVALGAMRATAASTLIQGSAAI
jgi:hypothetical protein